jgi:uncharacterized membrane protein
MQSTMIPWADAVLRWGHVLAGVLWIGTLYFFHLVEAQAMKACSAESRNGLLIEVRPRALYWLRLGAAYTWGTGLLLMAVVYYSTADTLVRREVRFAFKYGLTTDFTLATNEPMVTQHTAIMISLGLILVAFFAYEAVWRVLGRSERAATAVSFVLFAATLFLLSRVLTARAVFLHAGALLGSIMTMNVWMRIWPAQRKLIRAATGLAPAPDARMVALAETRSKHNFFLSVPVLFAMISNHYPTLYDREDGWALMTAAVLAGGAVARWLHTRAGHAGAAQDGAPTALSAAPQPAGKA